MLGGVLSDVFLVVGSSLTVTPAADLPKEAVRCGAKLIIINLEETMNFITMEKPKTQENPLGFSVVGDIKIP